MIFVLRPSTSLPVTCFFWSLLQTDDNQHLLLVTWDDGHVSPFPYKWLRDHSFAKEAVQKQDNLYCRKPTPWGKDFQDNYPTADFNQVNSLHYPVEKEFAIPICFSNNSLSEWYLVLPQTDCTWKVLSLLPLFSHCLQKAVWSLLCASVFKTY